MTIGNSGGHYDEIGYNVGFTATAGSYNYVVPNTAVSIRLGWFGDIEFELPRSGRRGVPSC